MKRKPLVERVAAKHSGARPVTEVKTTKYSTVKSNHGEAGRAILDAPGDIITINFVDNKSSMVQTVKALKHIDPLTGYVALEVLPKALTDG